MESLVPRAALAKLDWLVACDQSNFIVPSSASTSDHIPGSEAIDLNGECEDDEDEF